MSSGGGRGSSSCMALLVKLSMSCMFRPTVLDDVENTPVVVKMGKEQVDITASQSRFNLAIQKHI